MRTEHYNNKQYDGPNTNRSAPNQTLSGQLLTAPTQSVDFNRKSIYTECIGRLISPFGFSLAPQVRPNQILQFDPPFRSCLAPLNSSTYTITSASNQTQILKNLPLQSEMKITKTNNS
jgi:hypothetical protein